MIYDPLFDPLVKQQTAPSSLWKARWIWHPGQRAAHIMRKTFMAAVARASYIGFPGSFNDPVYRLHLRYAANPPAPAVIRWAVPSGRVRLSVNDKGGNVTSRVRHVEAGPCLVSVLIDLTTDLPCLLLEGEGMASGPGWETSLDGRNWTSAECDEGCGTPTRIPTDGRDEHFEITPRSVSISGGHREGDGIALDAGGHALFDLWHDELYELAIAANSDAVLAVRVGESIAEAENTDPAMMEQTPFPPIALGPEKRRIHLPERALRYVRIEADRPCRIESLRGRARIYPELPRGSFECDDARLNEIFQASTATVRSNIHNGALLDGIKRDAAIWLGDQNIGFDAVDSLFLDRALVRNTLLARMPPPAPSLKDIGILELFLHCIYGFEQDYRMTGDRAFIERHAHAIAEILDLCESLLDDRGFISAARCAGSGDWPVPFCPDWAGCSYGAPRETDLDLLGTPAYVQMMVMRCFEIGAAFSRVWGNAGAEERYARRAAEMRRSIRAHFWDAERSAFITGYDRHGAADRRITQFAQKWGLLFDLVDGKDIERALAALDHAVRPSNVSISIYFEYLARIKHGGFPGVIALIRRIWGEILDLGFSRFPEDLLPGAPAADYLPFYDRPFGMSLNHLWAGATPVAVLMRGTLGFSIEEPGCKTVRLSPNWEYFGWVRCILPTPCGDLSLEYDRKQGSRLTIPKGMNAVIGNQRCAGGHELCLPSSVA